MRLVIACFASALLSSLFTVWLTSENSTAVALAQSGTGLEFPSKPVFNDEKPVVPQTRQQRPEVENASFRMTNEEAISVAVYERVNKSVVNITTQAQGGGIFFRNVPAEGSGSGMVIDTHGHILTNFHVIEDANRVEVNLFDGSSYEASLVGADPVNDIAIIKIDAKQDVLHPVTLGESSQLKVGMKVYTIGNPFGLERTMTTGIISSLNRTLQVRENRTIKSIIQIDAAVNPGNSGGPLLDTQGSLIGVNTAIASKNGQNAGVGFAIPVNLVARVVPQLLQYGRVIRPEIGIQHVYETDAGLLIETLTPGGPAEQAGLRGPKVVSQRRGPFVVERIDRSVADLIVGIDGQEVQSVDDFLTYIETKKPGDQVVIDVLRDGERTRITVKLTGTAPRKTSL
ncbi:MAG: trypsin-like peptidase domain-containing protein [Planctomycetaceae bacterium]|nr:trypsin-like peptidase domain-containing protein [Planctomycetaceae bacterium]